MRKVKIAGIVLSVSMAAAFSMSGCSGKTGSTGKDTAAESREMAKNTKSVKSGDNERADSESAGEEQNSDLAGGSGYDAVSYSIIGGADGPTSIYIAGKLDKSDLDEVVSGSILNYFTEQAAEFFKSAEEKPLPVEAHEILRSETQEGRAVCYVAILLERYGISQSDTAGRLELDSEPEQLKTAARVTFWQDPSEPSGGYQLEEFWTPERGWKEGEEDDFQKAISRGFPEELVDIALEAVEDRSGKLAAACHEKAQEIRREVSETGD